MSALRNPFASRSRRLILLPAGSLLLLLLSFTLIAAGRSQTQPPAISDWRFGIIETYESPTDAEDAGAAWTRVRFHWGDSQPTGPDEWIPPVTDEQIAAELAAGREVIGLLIGMPDWARDENMLPQGLWLQPDDPGNLWANYVRSVVGRYEGRINHWIIWNEPDIWDKSTPGHTWDGELEDFLQLQRTAYLVARQENPAAVIHLAAFTYFWDANYGREQYFDRLLDALTADPEAAGHNYYFDVATAHLYFQPNLIYDILQAFNGMMVEHGLDKPIWLVETNAPPNDDPSWPVENPTLRVTEAEQAAFMPQVLAVALAAGAERIGIYKLQDTESDRLANPEPFGLMRLDGSRRPAFDTYRIAAQYLAGARSAVRERWDEVGQVRLDQGDFTTTVLFSRLPLLQQAQVAATSDSAILVSMTGEQRQILAENGYFTVDLPPALCSQTAGDYCMIGGESLYLVQAAAGHELPEVLPAPAQSPAGQGIPTATLAATPVAATATAAPTAIIPPLPVVNDAVSPPPGLIADDRALVDFPQSVTFQLDLQPGHQIVDARLAYRLDKRACLTVDAEAAATLTGDRAEWQWAMVRSGNPPPGVQLSWVWKLTDAAGNVFTTPEQSLTLSDDRFQWRSVEQDGIRVNWYAGEEVGPLLLEAAVAGRAQLQNELGITPEGLIQFFIYGSAAEMRDAVLYAQDWAGGLAFTEYDTILMGVEPDIVESWGQPAVRHELAHLAIDQFGWSCIGGHRPTWLNEGLGVYAEGEPDEEQLADIAGGIENDAFTPLRSLNGAFPAHDAGASLAYSQSYSVVNYLISTYGAEKLRALLTTLAAGAGYDEALERTYGLNTDALELEWRAAIGAPPRVIPPTPTPVTAAGIPTVQPLSSNRPMPTPVESAAAPDAESTPLNCGLMAAPLLLFGLAAGRRPFRRRKRS